MEGRGCGTIAKFIVKYLKMTWWGNRGGEVATRKSKRKRENKKLKEWFW